MNIVETIYETIGKNQTEKIVRESLKKLTPRQQKMLRRRFFGEKKYGFSSTIDEIADEFGVSWEIANKELDQALLILRHHLMRNLEGTKNLKEGGAYAYLENFHSCFS